VSTSKQTLAEALAQTRQDLADLARKVKELDDAAAAALAPGERPRSRSARPGAGGAADPFKARDLAAALCRFRDETLPAVGERIGRCAQAAKTASERAEIDFWIDLRALAQQAGLACFVDQDEGEATVEALATVTVDFNKGSARVNGRAIATAHLPMVWRAVEEEAERLSKAALAPAEFAKLLSRAVRDAATRLAVGPTQPVPVLEAYRELLLLRQPSVSLATGQLVHYPRKLFALELSQLADERPPPADDEGMTVTLEPTTLPRQTVRIYTRRMGEYQRVGRLQRQPLKG
jgi:hypothetical protein